MKYTERGPSADICANCPAKTGSLLTAQLRGSSYRGRKITDSDTPNVDHCFIIVEDTVVADVMIADQYGDTAAAEHDADFINAEFENRVGDCKKPTTELTGYGLSALCTPASLAIDQFIKVNYEG
jgi:hypothetical protein